MRYRVLIARPLAEGLQRRYPDYPLKEILRAVRDRLAETPQRGVQAPFPFMAGTLTDSFIVATTDGQFQVTSLYSIDDGDRSVQIVEIAVHSLGWDPQE